MAEPMSNTTKMIMQAVLFLIAVVTLVWNSSRGFSKIEARIDKTESLLIKDIGTLQEEISAVKKDTKELKDATNGIRTDLEKEIQRSCDQDDRHRDDIRYLRSKINGVKK